MTSNQHQHGHREIMAVIAGDHFYGVNDQILSATPGTFFLFDHNVPHDRYYSPFQPALRNLWLIFSSPRQVLVTEYAISASPRSSVSFARPHECTRGSFVRRAIVSGAFVEAVTESWDLATSEDPTSIEQLRASATALFLHAKRFLVDACEQDQTSTDKQQIIEHIQEHIRSHPGDDLSVESLARLAGYAPTYFHRLFRRCTGQRLHAFVNSVRLEQAKTRIKQGHTAESISEELGFGTPAYFSRFFKQATGLAPSYWRIDQLARKIKWEE